MRRLIASAAELRLVSPRGRRRLLTALALLTIAVLSGLDHAGVFGYRPPDRTQLQGLTATVTYAADGDTIDVDIPDGRRPVTRVRLWGVDCPEIAHKEGEHDAFFGREAADFVRRNVVGRRVRLEFDPNRESRDRYGRLLAYVYMVDDGELLNGLLVRLGLAYADRRFQHVYKDRFVQIEKDAARQKAGLWAGVRPEQMPAWRQRAVGGTRR